jgi:hypothetical protein
MTPIHEEKAEYDWWLKIIYVIPFGLFIAALLFSLNGDLEVFPILLGEGVFIGLLFYLIMPRKYQIYEDRLRIVLGGPVALNIQLKTIKEAMHVAGSKAYVYSGARFATSSRYVIQIVRNRGLNYLISPQNGDLFLEQLNLTMTNLAH